jgi:hypothetical protein
MLVVSGVAARMAGIGCRRQEWHEEQRKQYCHDTHAIHGDPLALMDRGRSCHRSLAGEDRLQIAFLKALRLNGGQQGKFLFSRPYRPREWAGTGAKYLV